MPGRSRLAHLPLRLGPRGVEKGSRRGAHAIVKKERCLPPVALPLVACVVTAARRRGPASGPRLCAHRVVLATSPIGEQPVGAGLGRVRWGAEVKGYLPGSSPSCLLSDSPFS